MIKKTLLSIFILLVAFGTPEARANDSLGSILFSENFEGIAGFHAVPVTSLPAFNTSEYGIVINARAATDVGFGNRMLYNSDANGLKTTLTVTNLTPNQNVDISFDFAAGGIWDGAENNYWWQNDYLSVEVNDQLIFNESFTYNPDADPQSLDVNTYSTGNTNFTGVLSHGNMDHVYDLGLHDAFQNIALTSDTLTISWYGSGEGFEGGINEFIAIDNIVIRESTSDNVYSAPGPIAGGGLLGFIILALANFFKRYERVI